MNSQNSPLNNWPIQLSLVSETAEYFSNSELLIAADCTAFSCLHYHQELKDKVLLICCPKLDDITQHLTKLRNIFIKHNVKTITIARMSVPCCAKLTAMVFSALEASGKQLKIQEIIIDEQGIIIS